MLPISSDSTDSSSGIAAEIVGFPVMDRPRESHARFAMLALAMRSPFARVCIRGGREVEGYYHIGQCAVRSGCG